METHKLRGYSINDFLEWYKRSELELSPKFQRRKVWSDKAKSYLIDTIIRGLPIPKLFIRQRINPTEKMTVREVVDGQQRLAAIFDYIEEEFTISRSHNASYGGIFFDNLPEDVQEAFLSYELSVDLLSGATDAEVLDIFARLNSYTAVLKTQEKLNAKYYGLFKQTVYKLGYEHLTFWIDNRVLTYANITRMAEAELTSELTVAMIDGLQDKKKSIESFYEIYDEDFPGAKQIIARFRQTINTIGDALGPALRQSSFRRKALFYALFCVFYDFLYCLPGGKSKRRHQIAEKNYEAARNAILYLSVQIKSDSPLSKYIQLNTACARQTDNIGPRQVMHRYLWNALSPFFSPKG